jgi:hypothetical protein
MGSAREVSTNNSECYTTSFEAFRIYKDLFVTSIPIPCQTLITCNIYLIIKYVIVLVVTRLSDL